MTLDVKSIPKIILNDKYKSKQKRRYEKGKLHIYRRDRNFGV